MDNFQLSTFNFQLSYVEVFGVVTGLLYLYFQIKQQSWMWVVGFLTGLVYVWVFYTSAVYANMCLQLYYVVASVYGFWLWKFGTVKEEAGIVYKSLDRKRAAVILSMICLIGVPAYFILSRYTDSTVPAGDAFTAAIGIVATWMLAQRIIQHWLFWMVADSVSIYIYYRLELYPTMFLYLCYIGLAVIGYREWKKKGVEQAW